MARCGLCKWFREKREELLFEQEDWKLKQQRYSRFFAEEQCMAPEQRTMTGLQYKAKQDEIERELVRKDKQIKFHNFRWSEHLNSPQCRNGGHGEDPQQNAPTRWLNIDEKEFQFWQKAGRMTRTVGEGKGRRYEVMDDN